MFVAFPVGLDKIIENHDIQTLRPSFVISRYRLIEIPLEIVHCYDISYVYASLLFAIQII